MVCRYFIGDYLGFCAATAYSHVPLISEMEQLCFKDVHACPIYNEYESGHVPVVINDRLNAKQLSSITK